MLKVQDLFVAYGGIEALKGISLEAIMNRILPGLIHRKSLKQVLL